MAAVTHSWEVQRRHETEVAHKRLHHAVQLAESKAHVTRQHVHHKVLPPAGGASGVAEALVEYTRAVDADVAVLGSRGMGAVKR